MLSNRNNTRKPYAVYVILTINTILIVLMEFNGTSTNPNTLNDFGALNSIGILHGQYWRLVTAIFLHIGFMHYAVNSVSLFIIGSLTERIYGSYKFILIYLISGIFASSLSFVFSPSNSIGAGASGAIFGLLSSLGSFYLINRDKLGKYGKQNFNAILMLAVINLGFGFMNQGIDNWAHIGGLLAGYPLAIILRNVKVNLTSLRTICYVSLLIVLFIIFIYWGRENIQNSKEYEQLMFHDNITKMPTTHI